MMLFMGRPFRWWDWWSTVPAFDPHRSSVIVPSLHGSQNQRCGQSKS
jgi:hypothetical protein